MLEQVEDTRAKVEVSFVEVGVVVVKVVCSDHLPLPGV